MNFKKVVFLWRYYLANAILSKLSGGLAKHAVRSNKVVWESIKAKNFFHNWLVVGNGPSLKLEDLEALMHLPSIASNKITLLYNNTHWRPTLYTIGDPLLLFKLPSSHYDSIHQVLVPHFAYYLARTKQKLPWRSVPITIAEAFFESGRFIPDPVNCGFFGSGTITVVNIQLAMWCGAKKIFLIGCDHNYREESYDEVKKLSHEGVNNHFHPEYRKAGEIVNNAPMKLMERGYKFISRMACSYGTSIINISRGTALKTFECGTVDQAVKDSLKS